MGVRVLPCAGRWVNLPIGDRCRLGLSGSTLGQDAILGQKMYDVSGRFRVVLGPLDFDAYRRFLPDGPDRGTLATLVRFFVTDRLDQELELELLGPEVPPLALDTSDPEGLPRLGWTTWLKSQPGPQVSAVFQ